MFTCCVEDTTPTGAVEISIPAQAVVEAPAPAVPKVEPAPEFGNFTVEVSTKGFGSIGITLDSVAQSAGAMISGVSDTGAINAYNKEVPSRSLQVYDTILEADGVKGCEEIRKLLTKTLPAEKVSLKVCRPKKVQISFEKTGPLGVKMDFKDSSKGCVISEVSETGMLAAWNRDNPEKRVGIDDRMVEFGGKSMNGTELVETLKKEQKIPLTVLKY